MLAMKPKEADPPPPALPPSKGLGPVRLRQVSTALLNSVAGRIPSVRPPLACPVCQWIPFAPVTLRCGHTVCKPCLDTLSVCPECAAPLPPVPAEPNVLIKAAVEKWWSSENEASNIRKIGDSLRRSNLLSKALDKYNSALKLAPQDPLLLDARSDVLLRLNRCEESLHDAQALTRLRPHWPKGYYRRGLAFAHIGQYEDALLSFSISVALEKNSEKVKSEFTKSLNCFLNSGSPCKSELPSSKRLVLISSGQYYSSTGTTPSERKVNFNRSAPWHIPQLETRKLHALLDRIYEEIEKTKKINSGGRPLILRRRLVEADDFECILCCRTLWRPVTTPCGHTYCSMCLDRCLDYSPNCPLCMTSLSHYLGNSEKNVTEWLEAALALTIPEEYASRLLVNRQEALVLASASDIPVFVCTTAFPTVPCPIFVFEPRYRLMIRRAIESGGRFGMAACMHQPNGVKRFAEFGTILDIKDAVMLSDGCSILSNVGIKRFRVVSRSERDGYDTAQIQYITDDPIPQHSLSDLEQLHDSVRRRGINWFKTMGPEMQSKILSTFGSIPPLESNWMTLEDGPAWAWWLLAILPLGQHLQIGILATTCLEKRLKAIDKTLKHFEEGPHNVESISNSPESGLKRLGTSETSLT